MDQMQEGQSKWQGKNLLMMSGDHIVASLVLNRTECGQPLDGWRYVPEDDDPTICEACFTKKKKKETG